MSEEQETASEPDRDLSLEKVALIGTGNMGTPMAASLAGAISYLGLYDANIESAVAAAAAAKCHVASSFEEAVKGAECVILMLPNGDIVRNVLFEDPNHPDMPSAGLKAGMLVVDMSSSYPLTTTRTGAALAEHGIMMCDAPVSGGVKRAIDGSLTIMLGGDNAETLDQVEPMLESMGKVSRTGGLGSGHAMKALNNYLSAISVTATSEAVLVGRKFGLSPAVMIDIINSSTGRNNATDLKFHQHILNGKFGSGFHLDLMTKDVGAASRMAEELGLSVPGLAREAELWADASTASESGADHTEIFNFIENLVDEEPGE